MDTDQIVCRKLRLPPAQKIGVYVIFSVGWSVVTVSSVRTYYTHSKPITNNVPYERPLTRSIEIGAAADLSWTLYQNFLLSHLEICLGCLCATAPSLRIFYRVYMKALPSQCRKAFGECFPYTVHIQRRHPSSGVELPARSRNRTGPDDEQVQYSFGDMLRTPIIPDVDQEKRKDSVAAGAVDVSGTDSTTSQCRTPKQKWQHLWQDPKPTTQPRQDLRETQPRPPIDSIPEAQGSDDVDLLDNIILTHHNRAWLRDEETGNEGSTDLKYVAT